MEPELELLDYLTYNEAVKPRLAAGTDLADIIRLPNMDSDMAYIQAGLFVDLTDLFDKYGFNMKKALEAYGATVDDLRTPDGKIYYVPMLSNATTLSHTLHLNVQWLKTWAWSSLPPSTNTTRFLSPSGITTPTATAIPPTKSPSR